VATCSGGLHLGVLGLFDDGLEPSKECSSLGVVQHGNHTWQRTSSGMNSTTTRGVLYRVNNTTRCDEQYCMNSIVGVMNSVTCLGTVPARVLYRRNSTTARVNESKKKNSDSDYHVSEKELS
jgi:hypothetical protein